MEKMCSVFVSCKCGQKHEIYLCKTEKEFGEMTVLQLKEKIIQLSCPCYGKIYGRYIGNNQYVVICKS
uniref:Uncharacterized protein n=1 Tax=Oryzias sinensis TaxID=183150 RepID=A0A8C7YA62_9TELE